MALNRNVELLEDKISELDDMIRDAEIDLRELESDLLFEAESGSETDDTLLEVLELDEYIHELKRERDEMEKRLDAMF